MTTFIDRLESWLASHRDAGLLRRRITVTSPQGVRVGIDDGSRINFASNDYLGFANHPSVVAAMQAATERYGCGAGASHLICGHMTPHEQLEHRIAAFTGAESALVFSTGYMANLALMSCLADRRGEVLADKLNHASLIDGALLSRARMRRYRHADAGHAAELLGPDTAVIVSDSVFSMDGDIAPVSALADLARGRGIPLILDDAHGLGVLGEGHGIRIHAGLAEQVIVMGTLGKALGAAGAFVAGPRAVTDALVQFARPYIYTTAMPPALVCAVLASIQLVDEEHWRLDRLRRNVDMFRNLGLAAGLPLMNSETPIQPLLLGEAGRAVDIAGRVWKDGYLVSAIRPPTVPAGGARIRIALSADHEEAQIKGLISSLAAACTGTAA